MTGTEAVVVRKQIVVDAPIEKAFALFTDGFGAFKPPEHNLLGVDIAETVFEPGVAYPEKEVNQRLAILHPDVASLRRYLVDLHFMARTRGVYRLEPATSWPS